MALPSTITPAALSPLVVKLTTKDESAISETITFSGEVVGVARPIKITPFWIKKDVTQMLTSRITRAAIVGILLCAKLFFIITTRQNHLSYLMVSLVVRPERKEQPGPEEWV